MHFLEVKHTNEANGGYISTTMFPVDFVITFKREMSISLRKFVCMNIYYITNITYI